MIYYTKFIENNSEIIFLKIDHESLKAYLAPTGLVSEPRGRSLSASMVSGSRVLLSVRPAGPFEKSSWL